MAENRGGGADLLVIFGITGDLARRLTFRARDHWNDLNRGASEASVP